MTCRTASRVPVGPSSHAPRRLGLTPVNVGEPGLPRVGRMDGWIEIAKWLAIAVGAVVAIGALIVGILSWFLNHPD